MERIMARYELYGFTGFVNRTENDREYPVYRLTAEKTGMGNPPI